MTAPPPPRAVQWRLLETAALVCALILLWLLQGEVLALPLTSASQLTTVIAIGTTIIVVRAGPRGMWSPSAVFFIILVMFHVGLVAAYSVGRSPREDLQESVQLWFYRRSTLTALWVTDLAMVGYALGVSLAHFGGRAPPRPPRADDVSLDRVVGVTGAVLIIVSVVAWFVILIQRGGPGLLVGSYREYIEKTEGSLLSPIDRLSHFGMAFMAAATQRTKLYRIALAFFIVRAGFELPMGQRAEVLFPTFAALTVLAARRIPIRGTRAAIWAIGLLSVIAMIRDLRQVGLHSASQSRWGANPLDGLVEMGASLRPLSEVVYWHQLGDPFDHGATYWAPVDRLIYYFVPGWGRLPIEQDRRIMNNLVMERSGPIGFSIMAEAYRNFAATGAMAILFGIGLLLGRVDNWSTSRMSQCAIGVLITGLLLHVRNTFVALPAHFLIGLALLAMMKLIARVTAERTRAPPSPG